MLISESDLEQVQIDYREQAGGRSAPCFALAYIARTFQVEIGAVSSQVDFAGNRLGLDAYHFEAANGTLHLYHCVWSSNHLAFQEGFIQLVVSGIQGVFGSTPAPPDSFLDRLQRLLDAQRETIRDIHIHLVYNGPLEAAQESGVMAALCQHLQRKAVLVDRYFAPRPVTVSIQFESNASRRRIVEQRRVHEFRLPLDPMLEIDIAEGLRMHVGYMRLVDLHRMLVAMEEDLLSRNLRFGLPPDTPANRSIRRSLERILLEETLPPDLFAFFHNGITLHVDYLDRVDERVRLREPRLINGAQTAATVSRFLRDYGADQRLERNRGKLESITMLARIVEGGTDEMVAALSISTNKQNPVHAWNLRANDLIQIRFAEKFKSELSLYYARHEGMLERGANPRSRREVLNVRPLARTFLAEQGRIGSINDLARIFEVQEDYDRTFAESYLKVDARILVLAYKMQFRIAGMLSRAPAPAGESIDFRRRGRYLYWALLIQALLNDPQALELAMRFGADVQVSAECLEWMVMQAPRIHTVVAETLAEPPWRKRLARGGLEFLDSRRFFERTMAAAASAHGWTRRSFPRDENSPL